MPFTKGCGFSKQNCLGKIVKCFSKIPCSNSGNLEVTKCTNESEIGPKDSCYRLEMCIKRLVIIVNLYNPHCGLLYDISPQNSTSGRIPEFRVPRPPQ